MAVQITSEEELEGWLQDKPVEWAQSIAARAALRVFPFVLRDQGSQSSRKALERSQGLTLLVFRANFISMAAGKYPDHDMEDAALSARSAASAALYAPTADHDMEDAARSASSAASSAALSTAASSAALSTAASAAASTAAARSAASAALSTAGSALSAAYAAALWRSFEADCVWMEAHDDSGGLIGQPLWPEGDADGMPDWVKQSLDRFAAYLEGERKPEWRLILDWYRALVPMGRGARPHSAFGEDADVEIALKPKEFWTVTEDRSAKQILREIGDIVGIKPSEGQKDEESWTSRIVQFFHENKAPATLDEVREHFSHFDKPPADTTVRGRLSDLASRGDLIRLKKSLYVHPDWHEADTEAIEPEVDAAEALEADIRTAVENIEPQVPAAYRFEIRDGKIDAVPQLDAAKDSEGAGFFLEEARQKSLALKERLARSNADPLVCASIEALFSALPENLSDLNPYSLRSKSHGLQAAATAFATDQGERELFEGAIAALIDLSETVQDLQTFYPSILEMDQARHQLNVTPENVEAVADDAKSILEMASEKMSALSDRAQGAIHNLAELLSSRLHPSAWVKVVGEVTLAIRNFLAKLMTGALDFVFSERSKELRSEIWQDVRPIVVKGPRKVLETGGVLLSATIARWFVGKEAGRDIVQMGFERIFRQSEILDKYNAEDSISEKSKDSNERPKQPS
nr:hypothetical protein [uncultured Cohaesibacter sp.]